MNELPQPRKEYSLEEFLASLDQENRVIGEVRRIMEHRKGGIMRIYKKDSQLHDIVMGSLSLFRLPIVDKPLQIVIEARDFHEHLTGALFAYHYSRRESPNNDPDLYDDRTWGQLYLQHGYGYYLTGAKGRTRDVLIGETYRPDSYDKDLLLALGVSR